MLFGLTSNNNDSWSIEDCQYTVFHHNKANLSLDAEAQLRNRLTRSEYNNYFMKQCGTPEKVPSIIITQHGMPEKTTFPMSKCWYA